MGHSRSAPLTSVAQWMSGLFGHADLTPSDLVAALVLTAAAQQQRRRLRIKSALDEKLGSITEASSDDPPGGCLVTCCILCLEDHHFQSYRMNQQGTGIYLHGEGALLASAHCHMFAEKLNLNKEPFSWAFIDVHHSVC